MDFNTNKKYQQLITGFLLLLLLGATAFYIANPTSDNHIRTESNITSKAVTGAPQLTPVPRTEAQAIAQKGGKQKRKERQQESLKAVGSPKKPSATFSLWKKVTIAIVVIILITPTLVVRFSPILPFVLGLPSGCREKVIQEDFRKKLEEINAYKETFGDGDNKGAPDITGTIVHYDFEGKEDKGGNKLEGYYLYRKDTPPSQAKSNRKLIIFYDPMGFYFVRDFCNYVGIPIMRKHPTMDLFVAGRRGLTPKTKERSERDFYEDADAAFLWAKGQGYPEGNIYIYGDSLGTTRAFHVAMQEGRKIGGLIVDGAFSSIFQMLIDPSGISRALFFMGPWIVRAIRTLGILGYPGLYYHLDSLAKVKAMKEVLFPVLIIRGKKDIQISLSHSEDLFKAIQSKNKNNVFFSQPHDSGHNTSSNVGESGMYREVEIIKKIKEDIVTAQEEESKVDGYIGQLEAVANNKTERESLESKIISKIEAKAKKTIAGMTEEQKYWLNIGVLAKEFLDSMLQVEKQKPENEWTTTKNEVLENLEKLRNIYNNNHKELELQSLDRYISKLKNATTQGHILLSDILSVTEDNTSKAQLCWRSLASISKEATRDSNFIQEKLNNLKSYYTKEIPRKKESLLKAQKKVAFYRTFISMVEAFIDKKWKVLEAKIGALELAVNEE